MLSHSIAMFRYKLHIQITFRLNASFRDSFLAISRRTLILLSIFIVFIGLIFPPLFFIFAPPACMWKWIPWDMKTSTDWMLCDVYTGDAGDASTTIVSAANVFVIIANIIYETIFCLKLNNLLKSKLDEESSWKLKALIIKNSILTATAASTTFIFWFLWLSFGAALRVGIGFLYFDYWLNCFLVGLMFEYNEKYYLRLCPKCIICCFLECDKSFDKNNRSQHDKQLKRTQKYISGLYAVRCGSDTDLTTKTDRNVSIKTTNDTTTNKTKISLNDDSGCEGVDDDHTGMNGEMDVTIVTTTNFTIDNHENESGNTNIKLQFDSTVKISNATAANSSEKEVVTPTAVTVEVTTPTVAVMESKSPPLRKSNTVTAFSMTCNTVIPQLEHRITPLNQ